MQSPDHPELRYVEARKTDGSPMFTAGRRGKRPLWIVLHTMQAHELPATAENTANYFASGAGGRSVSSHYCADNDSIVQCVKLADSAWTVGNSQGNDEGINWELAGFAEQTREQWLDPFSVAMLRRVAPYVVKDAQRFGIPLRRCTLDDLRARRGGITTHNDMGVVFGGTNHWDPGPNFPWDIFMALLIGRDGQMVRFPREPGGTIYMETGEVDYATGKLIAYTLMTAASWEAFKKAGHVYYQMAGALDLNGYVVRPFPYAPPTPPAVGVVSAKEIADRTAAELAQRLAVDPNPNG